MSKLLKAVQTVVEAPPVGDDVAIYFDIDSYSVSDSTSRIGNINSNRWTISVWVRFDSENSSDVVQIFGGAYATDSTSDISTGLLIDFVNYECFVGKGIYGEATVFSILPDTLTKNESKWHHFLFSSSGTTAHLYIDDVQQSLTRSFVSDFSFTTFNSLHYMNDRDNASSLCGSLSHLYSKTATYLDITVDVNRRLFTEYTDKNQLVNAITSPDGTVGTLSPNIYFPFDDLIDAGINKAQVESNINADFSTTVVPLSLASTSPDTPSVESVDFDGIGSTGTYLQNPTNFAANGSRITISCWFKLINDEVAQTNTIYTSGAANQIWLRFGSLNILRFSAKNTSGAIIQEFSISTEHLPQDVWNHILISVETGIPAQHIYLNDEIPVLGDVTNATGLMNQSSENIVIGSSNTVNAGWLRGSLSELFMDRTYLDLSIESNRRLFINSDLTPANTRQLHLTPQAENVRIYLLNPSASIEQNLGAVGNFTRNGTLKNSLSTPIYDGVPTKEMP